MSAQINIEDIKVTKWSQWDTASAIAGALGVHASTVSKSAAHDKAIQCGSAGQGRRVRSKDITPDSPERKAHPRACKLYSVELLSGDAGFDGGEAMLTSLTAIEQTRPLARVHGVNAPTDVADAMLIRPTMQLPELSWRRRINAMLKKVGRVKGIAHDDSKGHHALRSALYDYWLLRMGTDIRKGRDKYAKEHGIKTLPAIEYMERGGKCEALYAVGWELWSKELEGGDQ